jgi:hypothetical protein
VAGAKLPGEHTPRLSYWCRWIQRRHIFASAAAVLLVADVFAAHRFVKPLDLIRFTLLRKLEFYLPTTVLPHGLGGMPWNV